MVKLKSACIIFLKNEAEVQ
ncbi:unnamed protein product [Acanthoscelides obtectus]|uniref:Uncharacterized protein n=1 Tax=Acanthoscelides obtectus TaxID=200917 RepID=A0A9P0M745_ACAOB|nr:unnamed protein product [Acanthoscelides obtectus]CAK1622556.1 hypothetical protein AOBTE_LOCUS1559 [Acanthoscelides obtectus]